MNRANKIALGTLGVLGLVTYFVRKKIVTAYNSIVSEGNFTASISRVKDISVNGTDLKVTMVLNVINHSPVQITIDSLFTKVIIISPDGTENEVLTTNPMGDRKISILPNNNTNVEVPLRAPIVSSVMAIVSIVKNKTRKLRLEVYPVISGVSLPEIVQTIDLNDVLRD